jgi:FKBP-type peptidyl-prolyl cis-trans isomerase
MRTLSTFMLLTIAGIAAIATAHIDDPKAAAPAAPTAPAAAAPAAPAAPKPLPVPTGEVVKKSELEGGLIVEDLKIGDGYEVKTGGAVVAHYHGTLKANPDKVFDSSFSRGEPVAFPLNGVIEGWGKGVPGMKVGGIRKLTIPAKMAYGERGAGNDIPPNSD